MPKEWTADQIRSFQDYFDALMSGNLARRRQTKFMPADFKLIEARQPPLKDQYDEWLARIICYAFSVPVSPFVSQVNRATGETLRQQATQEGLVPLKAWVKNALDHVIRECMNEPGLEFVWVGDDAIDPLEQAQTLQILVGAGIKTREEARADLGLAPAGAAAQTLTDAVASADATAHASADPSVSGGPEQKENIFLTAYAARGIVIYSGRSGGGDQALPFPTFPKNSFVARPSTGRDFACFLRSLHVRSRLVPATRQGRSRSTPRDRRCDGGNA